MNEVISYSALRALLWPLSLLPYKTLHTLGKWLGSVVYVCVPKFRKRALSNLALASDLKLSEKEIVAVAKGSIQNVMITCLEYPKLAKEKDISRIAYCENPDEALKLLEKSSIIFFCGHQANWELLFLEGTSRMSGVAIGRPTKNKLLYRWVVGIREKFGGTIIEPRNALRECLKALKKKYFLGIVGDQGMPKGGFACDFLGRPAYTSPLPAILAYRTGCPLLVATLKRQDGRYAIRYSAPIYADPTKEMESEIDRLMRESLRILAESIKEKPEEWLWQHNRWKQQAPGIVKRPYRYDSIRVLLPNEPEKLELLIPHLATLRAIYPTEHFTISAPKGAPIPPLEGIHLHMYETEKELFANDFASKLIFNFTESTALSRHYQALSAFQTLTLSQLFNLAGERSLDPSQLFYKVLCHAR